jgi:hypothetical protein
MKLALLAIALVVGSIAMSLDAQVGIHDPSPIALCNAKFYLHGAGSNPLVSDDGRTWRRGSALPRRGLAPDVIHIADRYYLYIGANSGAQPKAAVPPPASPKIRSNALTQRYAESWLKPSPPADAPTMRSCSPFKANLHPPSTPIKAAKTKRGRS